MIKDFIGIYVFRSDDGKLFRREILFYVWSGLKEKYQKQS